MKKDDFLIQDWVRFGNLRMFLPLGLCFGIGVLIGPIAVKEFNLLEYDNITPLLFSGIPDADAGFLRCFSTLLLSAVMGLIILFLLGGTAFGAIGIPAVLIVRGIAVSVGALSFLVGGGWDNLMLPALSYTPAAAGTSLLMLLFSVRALGFSNNLARAGFCSQHESLNFQLYFKDLLYFMCFAVLLAILGAGLAIGAGVFIDAA